MSCTLTYLHSIIAKEAYIREDEIVHLPFIALLGYSIPASAAIS